LVGKNVLVRPIEPSAAVTRSGHRQEGRPPPKPVATALKGIAIGPSMLLKEKAPRGALFGSDVEWVRLVIYRRSTDPQPLSDGRWTNTFKLQALDLRALGARCRLAALANDDANFAY
jgi:hypothetical protein